jgi:hypothetical protein
MSQLFRNVRHRGLYGLFIVKRFQSGDLSFLLRGASRDDERSGATPLSLAVRALVEHSDWTPHASPQMVAALLDAGARVDTVRPFPSGSLAADALLREHGRAG